MVYAYTRLSPYKPLLSAHMYIDSHHLLSLRRDQMYIMWIVAYISHVIDGVAARHYEPFSTDVVCITGGGRVGSAADYTAAALLSAIPVFQQPKAGGHPLPVPHILLLHVRE